jgi:hypothetical protein
MRKLLPAAVLGVAAYGAASSRRVTEPVLHESDWDAYSPGVTKRSFRNLPHFLYHMERVLRMQVPIAEVYLLRVLSPVLRESIMLVTGMANSCGI